MLSLLITARKLIALRRRCVLPPPRVFVNIKGTINLFLSNCSHERERSGWKATNLFPLAPTLSNNFYISVQMIFVRMNDTFVGKILPSYLYQNLLPDAELLNPRYVGNSPAGNGSNIMGLGVGSREIDCLPSFLPSLFSPSPSDEDNLSRRGNHPRPLLPCLPLVHRLLQPAPFTPLQPHLPQF